MLGETPESLPDLPDLPDPVTLIRYNPEQERLLGELECALVLFAQVYIKQSLIKNCTAATSLRNYQEF